MAISPRLSGHACCWLVHGIHLCWALLLPPSVSSQLAVGWVVCGTVSQLCTVVAFPPGGVWFVLRLTAQQLCEGRGGRPGLTVPNKPHGFCGRKAPLNQSSLGDPVRLMVLEVIKFFRHLFRPLLFLVSLTSHLDCCQSSGFSCP